MNKSVEKHKIIMLITGTGAKWNNYTLIHSLKAQLPRIQEQLVQQKQQTNNSNPYRIETSTINTTKILQNMCHNHPLVYVVTGKITETHLKSHTTKYKVIKT